MNERNKWAVLTWPVVRQQTHSRPAVLTWYTKDLQVLTVMLLPAGKHLKLFKHSVTL